MEARYTAWHYFLAEVMQHLIDERNLEVHPFEKLGTLPLEADIMKHSELRNLPEFTQDMDEIRRRLLEGYTVEERLEGLSTEEIRRRLSPEERLEGLSPEEILARLSTEEILAGLSPEELDKLRKLLDRKNH
jgi:hypothetical protein